MLTTGKSVFVNVRLRINSGGRIISAEPEGGSLSLYEAKWDGSTGRCMLRRQHGTDKWKL
jgi:hypothetical protein